MLACLQVARPAWTESSLIQDQLSISDVVAISKADIASEAEVDAAQRAAEACYPPKLAIRAISHGRLPMADLCLARVGTVRTDTGATAHSPASRDEGRESGLGGIEERSQALAPRMSPRHPARFESPDAAGSQYSTCGWMFSCEDSFDQVRLQELLGALLSCTERVKGVLRVGSRYVSLAVGARGELCFRPVAYRRESRIEVIMTAEAQACSDAQELSTCHARMQEELLRRDWQAIEARLVACIT